MTKECLLNFRQTSKLIFLQFPARRFMNTVNKRERLRTFTSPGENALKNEQTTIAFQMLIFMPVKMGRR